MVYVLFLVKLRDNPSLSVTKRGAAAYMIAGTRILYYVNT